MKKTMTLLLSAVFALSMVSCGNQTAKQEDTKEVAEEQNEEKFDDSNIEKDTEFAVNTADAGMLEVELGKLAQTNAASPEVKKFAQMMVDEHTKANDELKAVAQQKNITLPPTLGEKCQKKYNDLAEEKGEEFDKEYMSFMVSDHKDVIDAFEKQAEKGNDADLKSWASGKLPTLRHHLEMAQAAEEVVKNNKK
jgi:putative membrane protein